MAPSPNSFPASLTTVLGPSPAPVQNLLISLTLFLTFTIPSNSLELPLTSPSPFMIAEDGLMPDVYCKPTDSHRDQDYTSSQLASCKGSIPHSQCHCLCCICSKMGLSIQCPLYFVNMFFIPAKLPSRPKIC